MTVDAEVDLEGVGEAAVEAAALGENLVDTDARAGRDGVGLDVGFDFTDEVARVKRRDWTLSLCENVAALEALGSNAFDFALTLAASNIKRSLRAA